MSSDEDWTKEGTFLQEIDSKVTETVAKETKIQPKTDENGLTRKQRKNIRSRERRKRNIDAQNKSEKHVDEPQEDVAIARKKRRKERKKLLKQAYKLEKEKTIETKSTGKPIPDQPPKEEVKVDVFSSLANSDVKNLTPNDVKLAGARFRILNQQLYTSDSKTAVEIFSKNEKLSSIYHLGYGEQVKKWPTNPVKLIIDFLETKSKKTKIEVADLGCGDAKIGRYFLNSKNVKVHSFDLYKMESFVTVTDMSNLPLKKDSLDVSIFCLSLMGTNLADFIIESNRVLKKDGILKIAEVRSRFGQKETVGLKRFIRGITQLGFYFNKKQADNKMSLDPKTNPNSHFLLLEFKKVKSIDKSTESIDKLLKLEACLYKNR